MLGSTSPNTHFLKALAAGSLDELVNSYKSASDIHFPFRSFRVRLSVGVRGVGVRDVPTLKRNTLSEQSKTLSF